MTSTTGTLNLGTIGKGRSIRDAALVAFLAILLGAFVAEISGAPSRGAGPEPVASAANAAIHG
jgi:hypothetical protein